MSHVRKRCVVRAQLYVKCGVLSTCLGLTHDSALPSSPTCLSRRLGKIGSLAGSASGTICPDRGPETQLDRRVEKAASPMGAGDHWWTSSCDITDLNPRCPTWIRPDARHVSYDTWRKSWWDTDRWLKCPLSTRACGRSHGLHGQSLEETTKVRLRRRV